MVRYGCQVPPVQHPLVHVRSAACDQRLADLTILQRPVVQSEVCGRKTTQTYDFCWLTWLWMWVHLQCTGPMWRRLVSVSLRRTTGAVIGSREPTHANKPKHSVGCFRCMGRLWEILGGWWVWVGGRTPVVRGKAAIHKNVRAGRGSRQGCAPIGWVVGPVAAEE